VAESGRRHDRDPTQHIILIQDGAKYHTSAETQAFFTQQAARLQVFQLPTYSPDGSVSDVEMVTPMLLICKPLFLSISTFETPPSVAPNKRMSSFIDTQNLRSKRQSGFFDVGQGGVGKLGACVLTHSS